MGKIWIQTAVAGQVAHPAQVVVAEVRVLQADRRVLVLVVLVRVVLHNL